MSASHIEHLLLFKLNHHTLPSEIESFIRRLNTLRSIDQVLSISAGPLRTAAAGFTHFLLSRYASEEDMAAYVADPTHVAIVRENSPLVAEVLSVDWIGRNPGGSEALAPGSAARAVLLRLKESSGGEGIRAVMEAVRRVEEGFVGVSQFSFGENFSPERAKGFSVVFMAVFRSAGERDSAEWKSDEGFKEYLDSSLVVDFDIPLLQESDIAATSP